VELSTFPGGGAQAVDPESRHLVQRWLAGEPLADHVNVVALSDKSLQGPPNARIEWKVSLPDDEYAGH
jgi:hypothetical protein